MKKFLTKTALGAAALLCFGIANAVVIDFETVNTTNAPFAPLLSDLDYVTQNGYAVQAYDAKNTTSLSDGTLVGAMINGADSSTCLDGVCPSGNTSRYFGSIDDGVVFMQALNGGAINLASFSAAFLAPSGVTLPATTVAYIGVEADRADGSFLVGLFPLLGPNATTGLTAFSTFSAANFILNSGTGTFSSGTIIDLQFFAYYNTSGTFSFGTSNRGQFALDNITVNVPEPSDWLLMAVGLAGVGALVRRRTAA